MKLYMYALFALLLLVSPALSWAEEVDNAPAADEAATAVKDEATVAPEEGVQAVQEEVADEYQYEESAEFPEQDQSDYRLDPVIKTWAGINVVDVEGANRAAEYLWPHTSFTGGLLVHYSPLPHRTDFELDWVNPHDYSAEVGYAYRDVFRLDYRGWSLFHNLDHYVPLTILSANHADQGAEYDVTARSNKVSLRLKWPDRAYHVFASYRQFDKEGTVQQRFKTGGSTKFSRSRDINWTTRDIITGINGHFGPIEAEYSHRIKKFDAGGVTSLTDAGLGVHNVVSDKDSSTDTVKLHTDLTGRVAGSVTLVSGDKKNDYSMSYVDFKRAAGDLVFIPLPNLTVAMNYRYSLLQTDVQLVAGAKDPIDKRTNSAELAVRYSPTTRFSLKGGYKFTNVKRYGVELWNDPVLIPFQNIPYDQNLHDMTLSAMVRPIKNVTARGKIGYTYTGDPALPANARNSFKGKFDAAWTPAYNLSTSMYYNFARDENGNTNMDSEKDNAGLMVSWLPAGSLSLNCGYDYFRYNNERDIQFILGAALDNVRDLVVLRDTSHVYYIGAGYRFAAPLTLDARFHQSWSRSKFRTDASDVAATVSTSGIGELTDVQIRETGGSFRAAYELPKGWGTSVEYNVNDYQDLEDKAQSGVQDGLAHSVVVMLSKNW